MENIFIGAWKDKRGIADVSQQLQFTDWRNNRTAELFLGCIC